MNHFKMWIVLLLLIGTTNSVKAFEKPQAFEESKSAHKILVFFSQSCPCSRSHVEHLNQLNKKYKELAVFGVITDIFDDSTADGIKEYYANKNFNFPLIKDDNQVLVKKYKALKTPHSILLSKDVAGDYIVNYEGGVTDARDFSKSKVKFLSENMEALIKGEPVKYKAGKSLGCYIRRI